MNIISYKKALITGATSGIGLGLAKNLAANGLDLILIGRRIERLRAVQHELVSNHKIDVDIYALDITHQEQLNFFLSDTQSKLETVDLLINNAGLAKGWGPFVESDPASLKAVTHTNVLALMELTRALLPILLKKKRAYIVNIGSVAGKYPCPSDIVYSATKYAVRGFTEGLHAELRDSSVKVTLIEPGAVDTEFANVRLDDPTASERGKKNRPYLRVEDVVHSIQWCLSQKDDVSIPSLSIMAK